jgi:hypothetical protein
MSPRSVCGDIIFHAFRSLWLAAPYALFSFLIEAHFREFVYTLLYAFFSVYFT